MNPINYIVKKIDGDYCYLLNLDNNEELFIARALLPDDIDEGTKLLFENFMYEIID